MCVGEKEEHPKRIFPKNCCLLLEVGIDGSFGPSSDGLWQSLPPSGGLSFIGVDDDGGLGSMKILNDPFVAQQCVS